MLCYTYIAYIVIQRYTVHCLGPDEKFHSTKISLFLCSLNKTYLYHYLHQRPLVYNSLTLEGDLAHRKQTVNIFTFPQATKNLFEGTKLPTDIWLAIPVTLTVMSNGLNYLQGITPDVLHCTYMFNCI